MVHHHPENTITSKKRKRKVKKNQNLRTRKTNEDVEQASSLRTFSIASIEGASTDASTALLICTAQVMLDQARQ